MFPVRSHPSSVEQRANDSVEFCPLGYPASRLPTPVRPDFLTVTPLRACGDLRAVHGAP